MTTTIGELCMGYGGLGMGLSAALGGDTRVAWAVEYDKHPSAIVAHRYPGVPNYGDVKTTDWAALEPVDWLTAGYPCQPFSLAGLRKGADDPRHLWPGVARAIRVLRPRNVLLENVAAHLRLGFDTVLADLADLGYAARWGVVRASDAGAPHGRARLFVVAHTGGTRRDAWRTSAPREAESRRALNLATGRRLSSVPDAEGDRLENLLPVSGHGSANGERRGHDGGVPSLDVHWGRYAAAIARWERITGRPAPRPTEPGRSKDRMSPRFSEWVMGLPKGWVTDVPGLPRNAQLKALGNGVVPQQAALACRLLGVAGAAEVAA